MSVSDAYLGLVRANYRAWCYHVHEGRWLPGRAVSWLCERVQEFLEAETGNPYDVLVISLPPQHGKSMTITETLPSWYLCRWPERKVIGISYSEDFAQLFGRRNKGKLEQFGGIFGVELARNPNNNTEFETTAGGGMISRGVLSGVTGRACNLMIIDDPVKNRQEADSETYRDRVWDEWENSFKTRLAAGAKVIVIQTRWHEDDLAGRLLRTEKHVTSINLPCEAEEHDPLGRAPGEALCPEIGKGNEWLREMKRGYMTTSGSRAWNALFQGRPTSAEGNMILREWWQYYDAPPAMDEEIISVDAAFKDGDNNDFVAIQAWGKAGPNLYMLDALKQRLNFPETLRAIRAMKERHPAARAVLVEDKANGPAVIQMLRREMPGVLPVTPEGGKAARVNAVSGAIESGNVWLPRYAAFTGDFVEECAAFPSGAHDDQVDAMSQALAKLIYRPGKRVPKPEPHYNFSCERPPKRSDGYGERIKVI